MTDPVVTFAVVSLLDFARYLNNQGIDEMRARFILDRAQILCESVVKPLPAGADIVVLDVAERAYANPVSTGGGAAYYAEGEGPFSDTTPGSSGGGLYLTENNKETLVNLAGGSSAFTVDMLPAGYSLNLPSWDVGAGDVTVSTS